MDDRKQFERLCLIALADACLLEVAKHERNGIERAFGHGSVSTDALARDTRTTLACRLNRQTIGIGHGSRELGSVNGNLADGLRRNGVSCLCAVPGQDLAIGDSAAGKGGAKLALLRITDRELGIGSKQEGRILMSRQIMGHILHARLLIATQECAERIPGGHALAKEKCASVQTKNGRTLVVDDAAAEQPTVTARHGKRIGVPARAGGNHVNMGDCGNLALRLAGDICHTHIALIIGGLITELRGDAQRAIECSARVFAKRSTRLVRALDCHRGHCH